jgi:hypothetical protein
MSVLIPHSAERTDLVICFLDFRLAGAFAYAEHLVEVSLACALHLHESALFVQPEPACYLVSVWRGRAK